MTTMTTQRTAAEWLGDELEGKLDFSTAAQALSPLFSNVGLGFADGPGIDALHLYYNRRATTLGPGWLTFSGELCDSCAGVLGVSQHSTTGSAEFAFFRRDAWMVDARGMGAAVLRIGGPTVRDAWVECRRPETIVWRLNVKTPDPRDPDATFPVWLGVAVQRGAVASAAAATGEMAIEADGEGRIVLGFAVRILEGAGERVAEDLAAVPASIDLAQARTAEWMERILGRWTPPDGDAPHSLMLARAVHGLLSNGVEAPGLLAGRVAAFPNRATYACHYLWDSCFQNLAWETINPALAADSLLLLTENLRADGKMGMFVCSTWQRPGESQPPLVGWAAVRLIRRTRDVALARRLLPALRRNTAWWQTQRGSHRGLIVGAGPMETGWDDTPRFDGGPVIAVDLNAYLLLQMRACAELAALGGEDPSADLRAAETFAALLVEQLFDRERGLFFDRSVATGEFVRLETPACFLPLLAGVALPESQRRQIIREHLLNPQKFFGPFPFPSVAYDEPSYQPGKWWRGPVWLPVAYLMLEVLSAHGFHEERKEAGCRLLAMLTADGNLRELFNSETGEGLGSHQQGWTAAIALRLADEIARR
jgi:hypothetical protein